MRNQELETKLKEWFEEMINRYNWLQISFEYNANRGVYLVSYAPSSEITESDRFIQESMDFENRLNMIYGDEAPLFCDEEKYFKLSDSAEVFQAQSNDDYELFDVSKGVVSRSNILWVMPEDYQEIVTQSQNYSLAA